MSIFNRLFESKEARKKRMEAEQLAEEAEMKRAAEEIKVRRLDAERRAEEREQQLAKEKVKRLAQEREALRIYRKSSEITANEARKGPPVSRKETAVANDEETKSIISSISMIGRNDLLGPPPYDDLLDLGKRAIPHLLPLLDLPLRSDRNDLTGYPPEFQNNITIVAAAAELLGRLGAAEAIPKLRALSETNWFEVQRNARASLTAIEATTNAGLALDRSNAYQQIADLWTAIVQGRKMPYPAASLAAWASEAIAAMSDLTMPDENKAPAWAMLGSLYYKARHPDWVGSPYYVKEKCPEAKRCYQEALRISPNVGLWMDFEKAL